MDIFEQIKANLDALAEVKGLNKAYLLVDTAQKLKEIKEDYDKTVEELQRLKATEEAR